jgi:regulatory protein
MGTAGPDQPVAEAARWLANHGVQVPLPAAGAGTGAAAADSAAGEVESGVDTDSDAADAHEVARAIVLSKLSVRARTRHELEEALQAKKVPTAIARQVLDRMASVGLVDDTSFASDWVESRQQRRHLSAPALRRELQAKGVDRNTIDIALASVDDEAELAAARALVERKSAAMASLSDQVRYRRLAGMLSRRGFGPVVIARVLDERPGESP